MTHHDNILRAILSHIKKRTSCSHHTHFHCVRKYKYKAMQKEKISVRIMKLTLNLKFLNVINVDLTFVAFEKIAESFFWCVEIILIIFPKKIQTIGVIILYQTWTICSAFIIVRV